MVLGKFETRIFLRILGNALFLRASDCYKSQLSFFIVLTKLINQKHVISSNKLEISCKTLHDLVIKNLGMPACPYWMVRLFASCPISSRSVVLTVQFSLFLEQTYHRSVLGNAYYVIINGRWDHFKGAASSATVSLLWALSLSLTLSTFSPSLI